MNEATPTKRPLKKGDPCWIRIQRDGKPVLGEYDKSGCMGNWGHWVHSCGGRFYTRHKSSGIYESDDAVFVAKPIPPNWRELMEAQ